MTIIIETQLDTHQHTCTSAPADGRLENPFASGSEYGRHARLQGLGASLRGRIHCRRCICFSVTDLPCPHPSTIGCGMAEVDRSPFAQPRSWTVLPCPVALRQLWSHGYVREQQEVSCVAVSYDVWAWWLCCAWRTVGDTRGEWRSQTERS